MNKSTNDKLTILYVHYGEPWFRGSEHSLLTLMSNLDRDIYRPVLWTNNPVLASQAQADNIETHVEEFSILGGWKAPRWNLGQWWHQYKNCTRLINHYQVDLVHCNSGAPMQWCMLAAKSCNVPVICHLHSRYPVRDKFSLGLYLSPLIVGVSQMANRSLLDDGYPKSCLKLIYNAVDPNSLKQQTTRDMRAELGLKADDTLLASVSSLIPRKGIDKLIEVTALLNNRGHKTHLMLIGSGNESIRLQQLARELEVEKFVHFMGEQGQVGACLKGGVDIYVTCPRDEAFGISIVEAQSLKLPVVASRVGGIPEVIDENESGLLTNGSLEEFTDAVESLIQKPEMRRLLGQTGALRACKRFGTTHFYHEFHRLYQYLIYQQGKYNNPYLMLKLLALGKGCIRSLGRVIANILRLSAPTGRATK